MAKARFPIPLLCAFLTLALTACARPKKTGAVIAPRVILRFASEHSDAYSEREIEFAECVAAESKNAVRVQVYAEGELGTAAEMVEQLSFGGIGLSRVSVRAVADISPAAMSVSRFGTFSSSNEMTRIMTDDFIARLTEELLLGKLVLLAWSDAGDNPEAYRLNETLRETKTIPSHSLELILASRVIFQKMLPSDRVILETAAKKVF